MTMPSLKTADICDHFDSSIIQVLEPIFSDFGGEPSFCGPIRTVKVFEDNSVVKSQLALPGDGCVLVVDGAGSTNCALLGGDLAQSALNNGWSGVLIHGCVRDLLELEATPIGIRALATHPKKSIKSGQGLQDIPLWFAGVRFNPGDYLYADEDGMVVSTQAIAQNEAE